MHWWMFYGGLTLVVTIISMTRPGEAWGASLMLSVLWLLWNASHWWMHPYNAFFPLLNTLCTVVMIRLWRYRMEPWKYLLIGAFLLDQVIHLGYFVQNDTGHAAKYIYDLRLNLLYLVELAAVLWGALSAKSDKELT